VNLLLTPLVALRAQEDEPSAVGAPSHYSPSSRQRRWLQVAEEPVAGRAARLASFREARGALNLPTVAIEYDPRARPRIDRAPRRCSEVSLVARHGWSRLFWRRLQPGFCEIRGRIGFWGRIRRRAFTIARERSGATPIRLTRTPSVAGSWERPGGEPGAPGERRPRRARPGFPDRVKP